MRNLVAFSISAISVILGLIIIFIVHLFYGKRGFLEGVPLWIIGPLGAPTTFLSWIISSAGFSKSIISQYLWLCFFYLLQYCVIAALIYNGIIDLASKKGIFLLILIVGIILISAFIMLSIIFGFWTLWGVKKY